MKQKKQNSDWEVVLRKLDQMIALIRLIREEKRISNLEQTRQAA